MILPVSSFFFFNWASLHWSEIPVLFTCIYKGHNMSLVIFCAYSIFFFPGLLSRPVLIMSVVKDVDEGGGWVGGKTNYFPLLLFILPQTFYHPCATSSKGKEVDFCVFVHQECILCFIKNIDSGSDLILIPQ